MQRDRPAAESARVDTRGVGSSRAAIKSCAGAVADRLRVGLANERLGGDLRKDAIFALAKSFDTFLPIGPSIVPGIAVLPRHRDARAAS